MEEWQNAKDQKELEMNHSLLVWYKCTVNKQQFLVKIQVLKCVSHIESSTVYLNKWFYQLSVLVDTI